PSALRSPQISRPKSIKWSSTLVSPFSFSALLDQLRHQARPACLMTGAQACPDITMKVLIEQDQIAPQRIALKRLCAAVNGPAAVGAMQKDTDQSAGKLRRHFPEGHHDTRAGGKLHFELIAVIVMEFLQRFDQQKIDRKPYGTSPIGVPSE